MLLPAEVRPFLLHADRDVREHALRYFTDAGDPSTATAEDLWAVIDRYPEASRTRFIAYLHRFPHTGAAAERLLSELAKSRHEGERRALARALPSLHPDAARRALADTASLARLPPEGVAALKERVDLASRTADELVKELHRTARRLDDDPDPDDVDIERGIRLADVLAEHHPKTATEWATPLITAPQAEDEEDGWLVPFALNVFSLLPFPGAPERLFDFIGEETGEYDCELADDALARLATPDAVRAIEDVFLGSDWVFQLYTSGALTGMRCPEAEQALIRLLPDAPEDMQTNIAMGLCELCTTSREALDQICEMVLNDDYDPMVVSLDDWLFTTGKMVGWSPPDPTAWREWRKQHARAQREQAKARRRRGRARASLADEPDAFLPPLADEPAVRLHSPAHEPTVHLHPPAHKPAVFVPFGKKAKKKRR